MVTCLHRVAHRKKLMVAHPKENSLLHLFLCVAKFQFVFVSNTHKINLFIGRFTIFIFFSTKLAARLPSSGANQNRNPRLHSGGNNSGIQCYRTPGYTQMETTVGVNVIEPPLHSGGNNSGVQCYRTPGYTQMETTVGFNVIEPPATLRWKQQWGSML